MPTTRKKIGGLVLKVKELEIILAEPKTVGLAFALASPGEAPNVSLKVLRVYKEGDNLVGEERLIVHRAGAEKAMQHPVGVVDDFIFKYDNKLKSDKYGFGFYSKESFGLLLKPGFDEVFIGGGKVDYGDDSYIDQTEWFTFTISLRKSIPVLRAASNGRTNTDFKWNGHALAQLPEVDKKGFVGIDAIRNSNPTIHQIDEPIDSLVVNADSNLVEGIIFKSDNEKAVVRLDTPAPIRSILTTEDETLRRLYVQEDRTTDLVMMEEEGQSLGLFPNFGHLIGCPPRWYTTFNHDADLGTTNTVKDAVEAVLKNSIS